MNGPGPARGRRREPRTLSGTRNVAGPSSNPIKPPISRRFPSLDAEDRRPLDVPAPYNNNSHLVWDLWEVCRDCGLTFWSGLGNMIKWIVLSISLGVKILLALMTMRNISVIVPILAWIYRYELFGIFICPSINLFCSSRYNLLSPLICPVETCRSYPSSTAEAAPSSILSTSTFYNHTEQQEYIRTLFRSPHSLHWSASSLDELNFLIQRSNITHNEIEALTPILMNVTETLRSIYPQASDFTLNYTHHITTIHSRIRIFEDVLVKTIDDYSASICPDRDFLRHHNTSEAGWRMKIVRYVTCKFPYTGSTALNAITVLQARFEEFLTKSRPQLSHLHLAASTMSSATSILEDGLTTFMIRAGPSLRNLSYNMQNNKNNLGFWARFSNLFVKRAENWEEYPWITVDEADESVLKRCDGDLMVAIRVIQDINFQLSLAKTAIDNLGYRLRDLRARDLRDGWGSATVLDDTADLRSFLGWMSGGGEGNLETLMEEVKKEGENTWVGPMIVPRKY